MRTFLVLLSLLSFFFASCTDEDNPSTPASNSALMPLAVGNEWTYESLHYFNGVVDTTHVSIIHIYRSKVDSLGERWYSFLENDTMTIGGSEPVISWWRNTEQGFEMFANLSGTFLYRYPISVGYAYSLDIELMYYNIVVSNTDTLIHVPAGTFRCYQYDLYDKNFRHFASDFLCPGVGWVLRRNGALNGSIHLEDRLVRYTLQ